MSRAQPGAGRIARVLTYHAVQPSLDLGVTWVTPHQFRQQAGLLARLGFRGVRVGDLLQEEGADWVALTFDDGYLSVHRWAFPVLQEMGWTGTIFPVVDFIGKDNRWEGNLFGLRFPHVDWTHLREMVDAGWEIGSHGLRHAYLPWADPTTLRKEIYESKRKLEDRLGIAVRTFCAPYGRADERVIQVAMEAGYEVICLLNGRRAGFAVRSGRAWILYRWAVYRMDSCRGVAGKVLSSRRGRAPRTFIQAIVCGANLGGVLVQIGREKGLAILDRFAKIVRGTAG